MIANGESLTIRLNGIDCPEADQSYGEEATEFAKQFLFKRIVLINTEKDKYGRILTDIYIDGVWLNALMVEKGLAWHYKQYSADQRLSIFESGAKHRQAGLWRESNPIAPWEWRQQTKTHGNYNFSQPSQTQSPTYHSPNYSVPQQYAGQVIICGGAYATKYHRTSGCRGLSNCRSGISSVSEIQAKNMGRSPCAICY